ncbi:MAG: hypothetical protein WAR98_04080, partial [Bacteroidales bacterium]
AFSAPSPLLKFHTSSGCASLPGPYIDSLVSSLMSEYISSAFRPPRSAWHTGFLSMAAYTNGLQSVSAISL